MYDKENEMYQPTIEWFAQYLSSYHKKASVKVFDTSQVSLLRFLERNNYHHLFQDYITYDIQVDITALVKTKKRAFLSFIECKLKPITLKDISQLLGYSRVAYPLYSLIISPSGISKSVHYLLKTFNRYDVLEYAKGKSIRVAKWNIERNEISTPSLIPPGKFLIRIPQKNNL